MSTACVDYILFELKQSFGEEIENICKYLLNNGFSTLSQIVKEFPKIKNKKINQYIKFLIDNNFIITFTDNEIVSYEFDTDAFLVFKRSARFLNIVGHIYGDISRIICSSLCIYGNLSVIDLIKRTTKYSKGQNKWPEVICYTVNNLIKLNVLEGATLSENINRFTVLSVDCEKVTDYFTADNYTKVGDKRHTSDCIEEWNIQFRINPICLNRLCLNDIISKDASDMFGEDAGIVLNTLLQHLHSSNIDSYYEGTSKSLLLKKIRDSVNIDDTIYEDCIYLLSKDNPYMTFIEETVECTDVLLQYNNKKVTEQLVIRHLTEAVQVIFGQNGLIVFNYLLRNPYVEEAIFLNSVMLPPDQLHFLLPEMLNKGYISKLELSKAKIYFDEPLVTLLFVDINNLVRIEEQVCYQSLLKLSVRSIYEEQKHKALLAKVYQLSVSKNKEEVVEEDEILVITDNDKVTLSKLNKGLHKLEALESSIQTNLIIFESFVNNLTNKDQ